MKSEERHELQQNDLASWVYAVPMLLQKYGSYILLIAACIVLAFQLWRYYEVKQERALQDAWDSLAVASEDTTDNPPAKLRSIIGTYDNRTVQAEAYRRLGKFYLQTVLAGNPAEGFRGVKIAREDALNEAESALKKVTTGYTDLPTAIAAATLELGAVAESRRDWDAAKKYYETLTNKTGPFAGTAFASEAEYRLTNLDKYKTPVSFGPPSAPPATGTAPASRPGVEATSLPSFVPGFR